MLSGPVIFRNTKVAIAKFGFELIANALNALMHPWWGPELRKVDPAA